MNNPEKIKLRLAEHTFYMDGYERSGGYLQAETKAVGGIYRTVSGKKASKLVFRGKISPSDKRYAWGILNASAGQILNFTAGDTAFSGYVLTDLAMEFTPGKILGDIKIELREAAL